MSETDKPDDELTDRTVRAALRVLAHGGAPDDDAVVVGELWERLLTTGLAAALARGWDPGSAGREPLAISAGEGDGDMSDADADTATLLGWHVTPRVVRYCIDRAEADACAAQMRACCSAPGVDISITPILYREKPET